jgi:hypothetical protein
LAYREAKEKLLMADQEIPAGGPPPARRIDVLLIAALIILSAWGLGTNITNGWIISSQRESMTEMQRQMNQQVIWMRQIQESQTQASDRAATALAEINVKIAEIKGIATARAGKLR